MKNVFIAIAVATAVLACVAAEPNKSATPKPDISAAEKAIAEQIKGQQIVARSYYPNFLASLGEKPLPVGQETWAVRFSFLPAFDDPWVFRMESTGKSSGRISYRCANTARGQGSVETADVTAIRTVVDRLVAAFPGYEKPQGTDGDSWVLEISRAGRYCVCDRWAPDLDAKERGLIDFVFICKELIRHTKMADKMTTMKQPRFH